MRMESGQTPTSQFEGFAAKVCRLKRAQGSQRSSSGEPRLHDDFRI